MGLYRTAIVQGLSIAHGRGERHQNRPPIGSLISIGLKDRTAVVQGLSSLLAEFTVSPDVHRKRTPYLSPPSRGLALAFSFIRAPRGVGLGVPGSRAPQSPSALSWKGF